MTGENNISNGAVFCVEKGWFAIEWQKANQNVRRLQARIVKAVQEDKWNKVKALQRLLTRSFSAKALAVRRVTENRGKRTSGVDNQLWDTPTRKTKAILELNHRGYKPKPLKRIYIPKSNGKLRPLSIPTMKDRAMQALYLQALQPISETIGDPNSYGFRKQRSTIDAIEQCFGMLAKKVSPRWILEGDIKACFDKINHSWLIKNIPMEKAILKKWLKSGFMEKGMSYETHEGAPQGGIISPVLANMALDGLEKELSKRFSKSHRKLNRGYSPKVHLIRYADDFIITARSKESIEEEILPMVREFLKERGLELSNEKTKITNIEDGFNFLGRNIRKFKEKLIIQPSKDNLKSFLQKVREIIKKNKQATTPNLITTLNPILKGWANFHRHTCSSKTFQRADAEIFRAIWKWCLRRHRGKGKIWIKKKYFRTIKTRNWVFAGDIVINKRKALTKLILTSDFKIRRHIKVKSTANPFDPAWETYFENRIQEQMKQSLDGRKQLLFLWKEQKGLCPVCNLKITKETSWHNHHIEWRMLGGKDTSDNRILLHPDCHRKVHSLKITVVKPCRHINGIPEA
jgi:RNA-directed DNA polymerase